METEQDIEFNNYLQKEVFPKEGMCQHGNYRETCWVCSGSKNKKKVLVAMSGGVDSSVVAALLKKQDYEVIGVFLKFWFPPTATRNNAELSSIAEQRGQNVCCNQEALRSARSVANQLKIPFYVLDVGKEFKKEVVDYYIAEYDSGRTPNPCVVCNKKIKFGWLLDKANELGCEYLATGHYARLEREFPISNFQFPNKSQISNNKFQNVKLLKPKDKKKDQTYFLWQLDQNQLKYILFPLGNYLKPEVRKLAKKWNLSTAEKKESQNVCFVPCGDNSGFLKQYAKKSTKSGNIVDKKGNILGKHDGLYQYTIGQRQGLPQLDFSKSSLIKDKTRPPKVFVLKLDISKNQLVVGLEQDLYYRELTATNINWIDKKLHATRYTLHDFKCKAKIRYGHKAENCKLTAKSYKLKAVFEKPQRAITPGQSVVFYKDDELVGGGIIK